MTSRTMTLTIHQNDIKHNDEEHNNVQCNDNYQNDIQQNNAHQNDIQQNGIMKNDNNMLFDCHMAEVILHNATIQNDNQLNNIQQNDMPLSKCHSTQRHSVECYGTHFG